jgi:hypothetical protein
VREFSKFFADKTYSKSDKLKLASVLADKVSAENLKTVSLDGRHYLLFALFLIPPKSWDDPTWRDVKNSLRDNINDLDRAVKDKTMVFEQRTGIYLDALRTYLQLD